MAVIAKNIENLKPDQEYIVTVRSINSDVNVASEFSDSIRFRTPTDSTIPSAPTNLELAASFFNVLFKYTDAQDDDIFRYEYELYQDDQVELVSSIYQPITGQTPHRTGYVQTNIFLVSIETNSSTTSSSSVTNPVKYYGRVRSIDTSNNIGEWTQLVESGDTPLIDEQYIGSLTAAKITAGEIGAHTIILSGGSGPGTYSIIKSSTYDFATPNQGWFIRGDGHFSLGGPNGITYDNETIVIGSDVQVEANLSADSITVGTSPNQLKINDVIDGGNGGMTLGDPSYNYWHADGEFRVGNASNYTHWNGTSLVVQGTIQAGTVGGVTISSTKLYIGTGTFNNSNTSFYVDNSGQFSLKDKFVWNGTSLTIAGDVTIGSTSGSTIASGAASGATALQPGEAASDVNSNSTTISGGKIRTGTIESTGYSFSGVDQFSTSGTQINLDNGSITSKNFAIDSSGSAYFKGTITASSGTIGGWNIGTASGFAGSIYVQNGSDLSLMSPTGLAWFSSGVVTTQITGFGDGVKTGGAGLAAYRLRNISIGTSTSQPSGAALGDIYLRY
jgi:hypothetical protein